MFLRSLQLITRIPRTYQYRFCTEIKNKQLFEEVQTKVFQIMKSAAKCKVDKLNEKATFEEIGFDSLDAVEMVVALEENFGFDIKNEEAERIKGVGEAIAVFYKYCLEKESQDKIEKV